MLFFNLTVNRPRNCDGKCLEQVFVSFSPFFSSRSSSYSDLVCFWQLANFARFHRFWYYDSSWFHHLIFLRFNFDESFMCFFSNVAFLNYAIFFLLHHLRVLLATSIIFFFLSTKPMSNKQYWFTRRIRSEKKEEKEAAAATDNK